MNYHLSHKSEFLVLTTRLHRLLIKVKWTLLKEANKVTVWAITIITVISGNLILIAIREVHLTKIEKDLSVKAIFLILVAKLTSQSKTQFLELYKNRDKSKWLTAKIVLISTIQINQSLLKSFWNLIIGIRRFQDFSVMSPQ